MCVTEQPTHAPQRQWHLYGQFPVLTNYLRNFNPWPNTILSLSVSLTLNLKSTSPQPKLQKYIYFPIFNQILLKLSLIWFVFSHFFVFIKTNLIARWTFPLNLGYCFQSIECSACFVLLINSYKHVGIHELFLEDFFSFSSINMKSISVSFFFCILCCWFLSFNFVFKLFFSQWSRLKI